MDTKDLLSIENFFSLSEIPFGELFLKGEYAWQPLLHLEKFFNNQKLGKIEIKIPASVHLENPELISIGSGTVIEPGAYIKGPCILGKNCTVRHGAYLREFVLAADHCVIGHDTEIKHSILLSKATAAHFAYVGDSILGSHVNLGAGVKCANFRLEKKKRSPFFLKGRALKPNLPKWAQLLEMAFKSAATPF
jgi:UDP-N-acetylglucosamine diphosphorylase / glucose-1-phosphate thymidylyltransferase / UDP-N-acetylgalactosamine diphosphorylase / glucosamine-1-phosphate N-acetyltransferase / galactosamine-1-phosphate N-acetyltransferase